jgi:hypothetical protein
LAIWHDNGNIYFIIISIVMYDDARLRVTGNITHAIVNVHEVESAGSVGRRISESSDK